MPEPAGGDDVVCLHQPFCDLLHDGLVERGDLGASLLVEGDDYALIARVQVIVLYDKVLVVVDALGYLFLSFWSDWRLLLGGDSGRLLDDRVLSLRFQATQHLALMHKYAIFFYKQNHSNSQPPPNITIIEITHPVAGIPVNSLRADCRI